MKDFPENIGKFEISAGPVKSETRRNTSSVPNSMSLPSRLCECKCEVVVIQDLLECGVVQLEGADRKAYCLFFRKDLAGGIAVDQKLSSKFPLGTKLLANARLIKENSVIPFLATSVWEDGASQGENELSKLVSSLEPQEIEQYNIFSRELEWLLPRDDCFSKKGETDYLNESNNNSMSQIKSSSRSPTYQCSQARSRTRSRSPRECPGRYRTKSPECCHSQEKARGASSVPDTQGKLYRREFSNEQRTENQIGKMEILKTEGAEMFQPSQTRNRSQRYNHFTQESSSTKYGIKPDFGGFLDEKKLKNESESIGRIKREAPEVNYHQQLTKSENESEKILKIKQENQESEEIGDSISVRNSCLKGSSLKEEGRNEDETNRREKFEATKDTASKLFNKTPAEIPNPTSQTSSLISDRRYIVNGKGKILKILNANYGIAIVLGFGRVCQVLFDIYDVWIDSQVCADYGKTLHDVMKEGDLVCLHAIRIENAPISSTDQQIEYMAVAVKSATNIQALKLCKLHTSDGILPSLDEVSQDKIKNFHQVARVVLATRDEEEMAKYMEKDEIPIDIGILWKKQEAAQDVSFFCFHCKLGHNRNKKKKWEAHDKHVLNCIDLKCLESGEECFQRMKEQFKIEQVWEENGGFNANMRDLDNMPTENDELFQRREFHRLKMWGNAGKSDLNKFLCFHCQYEGESRSHFTSGNHQDHVRNCGTNILDCPENPEISSEIISLIGRNEMLSLHNDYMSSSYHRYFCLHCKEPFSDKRHIQGVNHTFHMANNCCDRTCKASLLDDGKSVWCFICDVKLSSKKNIWKGHVKGFRHSQNEFNLLKKS